MVYVYRIGGVTLLASSGLIVSVNKGKMLTLEGAPLDIGPAIAPRKSGRKKRRPGTSRRPVASCEKCGRVFFQKQGVKQHVKHCKGREAK